MFTRKVISRKVFKTFKWLVTLGTCCANDVEIKFRNKFLLIFRYVMKRNITCNKGTHIRHTKNKYNKQHWIEKLIKSRSRTRDHSIQDVAVSTELLGLIPDAAIFH